MVNVLKSQILFHDFFNLTFVVIFFKYLFEKTFGGMANTVDINETAA